MSMKFFEESGLKTIGECKQSCIHTSPSCAIGEMGDGVTQQSFAESCDVHNILARYETTGMLPPGNGPGQYADVSGFNDTLQNLVGVSRSVVDRARAFVQGYKPDAKEDAKDDKAKSAAAEPAPAST